MITLKTKKTKKKQRKIFRAISRIQALGETAVFMCSISVFNRIGACVEISFRSFFDAHFQMFILKTDF